MRRVGFVLLSALLGLLVGCQTPSTASGKVVPYVAASYGAGFEGANGDFVVYLAEGKQSGPSIRDAVVTLDNTTIPWSTYGYYYKGPITPAAAGSEHTLRITHPTAFDPIEVKLTAPSGTPGAVTIANPPVDWKTAMNNSVDFSYSVAPVGSWSGSGTVVWAVSYDASYNVARATPYLPSGSSPIQCSFPATTVYAGFLVRYQSRASIPGATADSLFRIEGDQSAPFGFDASKLPPYRANIELSYNGTDWNAYSYFYDANHVAKHAPQSVIVAGKTLTKLSATYPNDFAAQWTGPALVDGSTISYSFTDPAGFSVSGTAQWKSVDLPVPVSSPPKDAIGTATTLTFAAPAGGWPQGSRLFIRVDLPNKNAYSTSEFGYGTSPIVFTQNDSYPFAAPNKVTIKGVIETVVPFPGYRGSLRLVGPGVSW